MSDFSGRPKVSDFFLSKSLFGILHDYLLTYRSSFRN